MVIENGNDRVEIKNILVGEVWFASGQSNMAFKLQNSLDAKADLPKSKNSSNSIFPGRQHTGCPTPEQHPRNLEPFRSRNIREFLGSCLLLCQKNSSRKQGCLLVLSNPAGAAKGLNAIQAGKPCSLTRMEKR